MKKEMKPGAARNQAGWSASRPPARFIFIEKKRPVVRTDRPKKGIYMKKGGYLHHKRVWLNSVKNKITISLQERKRFH